MGRPEIIAIVLGSRLDERGRNAGYERLLELAEQLGVIILVYIIPCDLLDLMTEVLGYVLIDLAAEEVRGLTNNLLFRNLDLTVLVQPQIVRRMLVDSQLSIGLLAWLSHPALHSPHRGPRTRSRPR